jgi:methyl-accepting chemotaxis protein
MKFTSITFKLLFLVVSAFIIVAVSVIMVADRQLVKIIDDSQNVMYAERLEVILATLSRVEARLQKTGLIDAYADDFKTSALNSLRESYYTEKEQAIYPFILDHKARVLMHPALLKGDVTLQQYDWIKKMVPSEKGNFTVEYLDRFKWYTYVHFAPWEWTICYAVPQDIKYAAASKFNTILIYIVAGIGFSMLLILSLIIARFTSPITRLTVATKAMAAGDLEQKFKLDGTGEVGVLARSFIHMQDAIRQTISELKQEIRGVPAIASPTT